MNWETGARVHSYERWQAGADLARRARTLAPHVTWDTAIQIGNLLAEWSPDPWVSLAILMQESSLRSVHSSNGRDLTVAQINRRTAEEMGCDLARLEAHHLGEALRCHSLILRQKMKECSPDGAHFHVDLPAWTCYHSFTFPLRLSYFHLTSKYLP